MDTPVKQSKGFGGALKQKASRDEEKQKLKESENKMNVYEQLAASADSKGRGGGDGGWRQDPFEKSDPWLDSRQAQEGPGFTVETRWAATWTMKNAMSSDKPRQAARSTDTRSWCDTVHNKKEEAEPPLQQPRDRKNKQKEQAEAIQRDGEGRGGVRIVEPELGSGGGGHRDRNAGGEDFNGLRILTDREIGACVVVGKFKSRTRTSTATSEALPALHLVGLGEEIVKVQGAGPTSTVAHIQLRSWAAVSRATTRFKEVHLYSPHGHADNGGRLWASRMKSFEEVERTAPV